MEAGLYDHMPFPDTPPAPPTEEEKRDAVLADLGDRKAELLDWLRKKLVIIYRFRCEDVGRINAYVTADDARRLLDADARFDGMNRNFLGALFKASGWKPTGGFHKSETPGSHANRLIKWRYDGECSA